MNRITIQTRTGAATGQTVSRAVRLMRYGAPLLFFSCFFIFLLLYIDPAVVYSSNGNNIHNYVAAMHAKEASPQHIAPYTDPSFRRRFILELTPSYFQEIACAPGGWTRFAVTLCIYACHYPLAGALAVTGLTLLFYWIFSVYIQGACGGIRLFLLRFVAPIFIVTMCAWYDLSYCTFLVPAVGALAFAVFYQRLRFAGTAGRALFLTLLFWLSWYLLQWGCLLFLIFTLVNELSKREPGRRSVIIAAAVNGVILYAIDAWFLPLEDTIRWKEFTTNSGLPLAMIGFFPLAAIVFAVWGRLGRAPSGTTATIGAIVRMSLFVCGIVVAALWLCREPVNRDTRTIARTVHHVMNGQWEEVLHEKTEALFADFPDKAGPVRAFMVHAMDHALCRTGRLGDKLFSFPQRGSSDNPLIMLKSTLTNGYVNWVVVQDLAMDLGMVNLAERIAGEIMENMGPFPDIIYRRSLIQIAKGNNDAAAVYLRKLACMPFYRAEAKRLLNILDNNGTLLSEPRIATMRANMDTIDYFLLTVSEDAMLKHLLQSNPGNKAAYDYLVSYCLLTGRLDGVAVLSPAAPAFGYTGLPRPWEEALCVYQAASAQQASSATASYSGLRQETVERFHQFARTWTQLSNDPAAAEKLAPAFGDSYFYFSIFRYSRGKSGTMRRD